MNPSSLGLEGQRGPIPIGNLVYDVGMHVGQDTAFYLKKGFRVIAIEANPLLVQTARLNFEDALENGQLIILNLGIDQAPGYRDLYVNHAYSEWSSLVPEIGARGGAFHVHRIPTETLRNVMLKYGVPHYLKIDIEGKDYEALESLKDTDLRPTFTSVETGPSLMWLTQLIDLGYSRFKLVNQACHADWVLPAPPQEGRLVSHSFARGSSGPFGEESPGEWERADSVRRKLEHFFQVAGLDPSTAEWADIHAAL